MEFKDNIYSYEDIRKGVCLGKDTEKIGAYALEKGVKGTLLDNPSLKHETDTMLIVSRIDGDIAGRILFFPSRVFLDGKEEKVLEGSSLFVSELGRKYSLGVNLMTYPIINGNNKYLLYAGISTMALPIYKKMKFVIFETPSKWQLRNTKPIFQSLGLKGSALKAAKTITNIALKPFIFFSKHLSSLPFRKYSVKSMNDVPQWVADMALDKRKKYYEIHDKKWFEWVLNTNFFQKEKDIQRLYGIYDKSVPVAFILIKERDIEIPEKNIDSVVFGSIVEWGVKENSGLTELIINKIAIGLFSRNTDIVQLSSDDDMVIKTLSKYGFFNHGSINFAFKDLTGKLGNEVTIKDNWRLRPGYSDVPFY